MIGGVIQELLLAVDLAALFLGLIVLSVYLLKASEKEQPVSVPRCSITDPMPRPAPRYPTGRR